MNEIEHLKQQRKAREDCVPWFEPTPREAALYFLAEWDAVWQTQEYLGRSHSKWWNAGRAGATVKPITDEMKAELRAFYEECTTEAQ